MRAEPVVQGAKAEPALAGKTAERVGKSARGGPAMEAMVGAVVRAGMAAQEEMAATAVVLLRS